MRKILTAVVATAALHLLGGGSVALAKEPLIAVFTKNLTNPAYAAARRGVDLVAAEKGATTMHFVPEKPDNVEQQKALVMEVLSASPDLVTLSPWMTKPWRKM